MKYVKAFGQFWYDFIIGDDWKVAAAVVLGLIVTAMLVRAGVPDVVSSVAGVIAIVGCWIAAVFIDVRRHGRPRGA